MAQPYRVAIRRRKKRKIGYVLLTAGALILYLATLPPSGMRVEAAKGVLVTREETLPEQQFFIISMYDSADAAAAQAESARFSPRGASGTVLRIGGLFHAAAAAFMQEEDALAAADNLSAEDLPARAIRIAAPQALLRVTASQRQIESLLLADEALFGTIRELGSIAARIDGGEVDLQGAQGLLHAQTGRLQAACDETSICPEGEKTIDSLRKQLLWAKEQMTELSGAHTASRLAFSSSIRCLQMHIIDSFCSYRSALSQ